MTSESKIEPGTKYDAGKPPLELISPIALAELGKVLAFGAGKYDPHNWRRGFSWSRAAGATLRHVFAWLGGETNDRETGLNHLAHAFAEIMFLLEFAVTHPELDDRWKPNEQD